MNNKGVDLSIVTSVDYTDYISNLQAEFNYYYFKISSIHIFMSDTDIEIIKAYLYVSYPSSRYTLIFGNINFATNLLNSMKDYDIKINFLFFDPDINLSQLSTIPVIYSNLDYISSFKDIIILNSTLKIENHHTFYLYLALEMIKGLKTGVYNEEILINTDNYFSIPIYFIDAYSPQEKLLYLDNFPYYSIIKSSYLPFCLNPVGEDQLAVTILINLDHDALVPLIDSLSIVHDFLINSPVDCIYIHNLNTISEIPQHLLQNLTMYPTPYYYYISSHLLDMNILNVIPNNSLVFFMGYFPMNSIHPRVISTGPLASQMLSPLITWFSHHYYREIVIYKSDRQLVQMFLSEIKHELELLYPLSILPVTNIKEPNPFSFVIILCEPSIMVSLSYTIPTITKDSTVFYLYLLYELPFSVNPDFKIHTLDSYLFNQLQHPTYENIVIKNVKCNYTKFNIFTYESMSFQLKTWTEIDPFDLSAVHKKIKSLTLNYLEGFQIKLNTNSVCGKALSITSRYLLNFEIELNLAYYEAEADGGSEISEVIICYLYKISSDELDFNNGIYETLIVAIRELNEESKFYLIK